jgi:predicted pyridoxine 5'-phosphate oxidase superfamily flavin-nucleotide-binding protein
MGPFHAGEIEVQARLGAREDAERVGRIIASAIPPTARSFLARQRMAVAASLDEQGRPWASLLIGPAGFIEAADDRLLRIASTPSPDDPLTVNLAARPELALLVLDPRTRQRVRFNGRGLLSPDGLFLHAHEVYGNCPKYIQRRRLVGESAEEAGEARRSSSLDTRQRALVEGADTFFIATWHPAGGADASHRGGRPGFVRVVDHSTLLFPDYPGNNMFNTLGNLAGHPRAGLLFVDFEGGGLLQLSGRAELFWEPTTGVRVQIEHVRETRGGSPLRFELVEPWPANPPLPVTLHGRRHLKNGAGRGPRKEMR